MRFPSYSLAVKAYLRVLLVTVGVARLSSTESLVVIMVNSVPFEIEVPVGTTTLTLLPASTLVAPPTKTPPEVVALLMVRLSVAAAA